MADSSIRLATDARLATEKRTRQVNGSPQQEHFQRLSPAPIGSLPLPLRAYLQSGAGSVEAAVNGSADPVAFDLAPGEDEIYRVTSLALVLVCTAAPEMDKFGNLAALATGLGLQVLGSAGEELVDLLGGQPIQTANDFAALGSVTLVDRGLSWTVHAAIAPAAPLRLEGADGERLRLTVSDDLSLLTRFRIFADGVREDELT